MTKEERIFTRKYNELYFLITTGTEYELLKASGIMRHLLIDGGNLIDIVNRNRSPRLKILFNVLEMPMFRFFDGSLLLIAPMQLESSELQISSQFKSLDKGKFLNLPILKTSKGIFNIIQIIKFLANKEGAVHFDDKTDLNNPIRSVNQIALLGTLKEVGRIVLLSLKNLKDDIVKLPIGLPLFAHYSQIAGGHVYFQGTKQFLENRQLNTEIKNGFGILIEIKVLPQVRNGSRVIFEIGGNKDSFQFKIQVNSAGDLECISKINSTKPFKVVSRLFQKKYGETWISIASFIDFEDKKSTFTLFINNHLVDKIIKSYKTRNKKINELTVGGNLRGKQNAAFREIEMIILDDKTDNQEKSSLLRYFEGKWKI